MKEPIILYPPKPEVDASVAAMAAASEHVIDEAGDINWRAAFCADPGIVSCPGCFQHHMAYGIIHHCQDCDIIYPTDWSRAFCDGHRTPTGDTKKELKALHPYWRYGFTHKDIKNPWDDRNQINWRVEIGNCFVHGFEYGTTDYHPLIQQK